MLKIKYHYNWKKYFFFGIEGWTLEESIDTKNRDKGQFIENFKWWGQEGCIFPGLIHMNLSDIIFNSSNQIVMNNKVNS